MKYIRELLKKIKEEQFTILINAGFSNTELSLISHYRNDLKEESDEHISELLSIKPSTLKKLQSGLLLKTLKILCSEDIFEQLAFLSNINCHKILIHLSKRKINSLKKEGKKKELKKLLLSIPYNLLSAVVTDYSVKDLKMLNSEFQKVSEKKANESTQLNIFLLILELYQYDNWPKLKMDRFKKEIDKLKIKGKSVELSFWKNKLLGDYYQKTDESKFYKLVKTNFDLLAKNQVSLPLKLELNNKVQYCFYLVYMNQFEETYNYYQRLKKEYPNNIDGKKGLRYVDLVSQVCITLGKYDEAKEMIYNAYPIEKDKPGKFSEIYFGNSTVLAMIDILENNLELAFERIQAAKIGLKKQYFFLLDSLLRLTEQAYYFKVTDFDFADTLYQKNIKFYKYHSNQGLEALENGHKVLTSYSKHFFDKKALSSKSLKYLEDLKEREFAFIGHFLEKLNPNP